MGIQAMAYSAETQMVWTLDKGWHQVPYTPLTSDQVERGIEVLKETGWSRSGLEDSQGRMCVLGAVGQARYESGVNEDVYGPVQWELQNLMDLGYYSTVHFWNDAVAKDQQEVEDRLMLAAKKLRDLGR